MFFFAKTIKFSHGLLLEMQTIWHSGNNFLIQMFIKNRNNNKKRRISRQDCSSIFLLISAQHRKYKKWQDNKRMSKQGTESIYSSRKKKQKLLTHIYISQWLVQLSLNEHYLRFTFFYHLFVCHAELRFFKWKIYNVASILLWRF